MNLQQTLSAASEDWHRQNGKNEPAMTLLLREDIPSQMGGTTRLITSSLRIKPKGEDAKGEEYNLLFPVVDGIPTKTFGDLNVSVFIRGARFVPVNSKAAVASTSTSNDV